MKTYESTLIGRYLVSLGNKKLMPLNMTKLQKLMFIVYGYFLTKGYRLVDEHVQAWPFGPVFPNVHKKVDYTIATPIEDAAFNEITNDVQLTKVLEQVVDVYAKYTATQLSNWSHMAGSPWEQTTKSEGFKWSKEIPDEYIAFYFSQKQVVENA